MPTDPLFHRLIDDAAVFPPGNLPLAEAVPQHAGFRSGEVDWFVGPLVVGPGHLAQLPALVNANEFPDGLRVSAVVPPADLAPAVFASYVGPQVQVACLEIRLPATAAPDDVNGAADGVRRLVDDGQLAAAAPVYVEVPRPGEHPAAPWFETLDAVAARGLRLKYRTGGTSADAFPTARELATEVDAAVARSTPFKCTAGLHNALRHRDPSTGFEHHGFLNVLLATADAHRGADVDDIARRLGEIDAAALTRGVADLDDADRRQVRGQFVSIGSCSVAEPLADLTALGLFEQEPVETR